MTACRADADTVVRRNQPFGRCRYFVQKCHSTTGRFQPAFFVNSVTFIGKVIRHAKLTPDQVKIVCSTSGESYDRNKEKIDGFPISTPNSQSCKINFYTSTCFEGCDIFDKVGRTYIVSDGTATHSMLDISTTIRQIAGRIRDTQYKEITHIYSKSRYGRDVSYEQFKASTEQETDKAERFLNGMLRQTKI